LLLNPITPTAPSTMVNELNYLGSLTTALSGANQLGAMQLAIWAVVDGKDSHFGLSSFGNTTLQADYNYLAGKLGLTQFTVGQGAATNDFNSTIHNSTYSSGTTYAAGTVIQVNGGPAQNTSANQNLITWGSSSGIIQSATPEPSSLAIAGLGALAFAGYGFRRRKAMQSKSAGSDAEARDVEAGHSLPAATA
jgi:PEP-CTERM motif